MTCGSGVPRRRAGSRRAEDELGAAGSGGDADFVEEDRGLIDEDGVGLFCAEDGDAAADVAGERLHVLERDISALRSPAARASFLKSSSASPGMTAKA